MNNRPSFEQGEIVLVRFPFTDLTGAKVRPVVVLRDLDEVTGSDDVIICAISSQLSPKNAAIVPLTQGTVEFLPTNLKASSEIRVSKIFTCDRKIIARRLGALADETFNRVRKILHDLFNPVGE
ncbi:MAG: type II toxin-antitoxin system PemK/MazF family toxin [Phycisphaerae bacterium]|nr:type II toxin-antitoxin system PemK/MazF family toxin [Phycisphaerae bacterium]